MKKKKKMIQLILAVLVALLVFLGVWHPWSRKEENPALINESDMHENGAYESSDQDDISENSTNQDGSPQGNFTILEDDGEIIIEVPEDQESDGF